MEKRSFLWNKKRPVDIPTQSEKNQGPMDPLFQKGKTIGSSGATLDLSRMLEHLLKDHQTFPHLPRKLQDGLRKVYRMTKDPFKYASEDDDITGKEAFFGAGDPNTRLRSLKDTLSKSLQRGDLPKTVMDALLDAQSVVDKEMKSTAPSTLRDESQEQKEEQKREKGIQQYTQRKDVEQQEDAAIDRLKRMFMNSRHYTDIYGALPIKIRRELEKLSMDPENMKYLFSSRAVFASKSVVDMYLESLPD